MPEIKIKVENKIAQTIDPNAFIVCGNSDYIVNFSFDEEWAKEPVKTAVFVYAGYSVEKPFNGNICEVPILENTTQVKIGVFAGNLKTTTSAYVPCRKSIMDEGGKIPPKPTEEVYNEIITIVNEVAGEIPELGASIDLSVDSDYILTVTLKNQDGEKLSEKSVDLPIENLVVSALYDNEQKAIVFTLQNGERLIVPVGDLVQGFVKEEDFVKLEQIVEEKQGKMDESLNTESKEIVGAINEVKSVAEEARMIFGETEGTAYEGNKGKKNADDIVALGLKVDLLEQNIFQSGLGSIIPLTETFITRQTANGQNILDPSPAIVKKIQGKTVKCDNLLNIFGRTKAEYDGKSSNTTVRDLSEGKYYVGLTRNNYWQYYNEIDVNFIENGFSVGGEGAGGGYGVSFPVKCKPDTKYTLSAIYSTSTELGVGFFTRNGEFISHKYSKVGEKNITFTTPTNCVFVLCAFVPLHGTTDTFTEVMLNEGDTALPYEEYFQGLKHANFEKIVSTGRNLLNAGVLEMAPSKEYLYSVDLNGTYTFSCKVKLEEQTNVGAALVRFTVDGSYKYGAVRVTEKSFTVTLSGHITAIHFVNWSNSTGIVYDVKLNEGSTALPYEPYTSNEFALSAPVQLPEWDYIYPQTGEIVRGTNVITLTGNENFAGGATDTMGWGGTDTVGFYTYFKKNTPQSEVAIQQPNPIGGRTTWICNKFVCKATVYDTDSDGFMANGSYLGFRVKRSLLAEYGSDNSSYSVNVTAFKAWLADMYAKGDPVIVSYEVMDEFKTTEPLNCPKQYTAHNGGSETVVQGETDNSEYGAVSEIESEYWIVKEI